MTRSAFDSIAVLRSCMEEINPHAVRAHVYELVRGGLPAQSFSDGRGSADTPLPGLDRTDQELLAAWEAITDGLDRLAADFAGIVARQRSLLFQPERPKDKPSVRADLRESLKEALKEAEADDPENDQKLEWLREQLARVEEPDSSPDVPLRWCASCCRVRTNGSQHHSPVADERRGGKGCVLCSWCLGAARAQEGRWPDIEMVRAHAEGRRVLVKVKP